MDKMIVVVFDSEPKAHEAFRVLGDLHREGGLTVYSGAVIAKDAGGEVSVRRAADEGPLGTALGMTTGALIGALGGPAMALGSTTFDGVSRTSFWTDLTNELTGFAQIAIDTVGLLGTILAVGGVYALAMAAAGRVTGEPWHVLAVRFAHSLVPIAFAYVVAHYFSFLFIEGQIGLSRLSDPFGRGWNLFGTRDWVVNLTLLSPTTIWYVQVFAIVAGHIGGVILAHDRAIAVYPADVALRTQYALLAVMIVFTATGLLILSGG